MIEGFAVTPDELTKAARSAETIADTIELLARQIQSILHDAAAHGGLEIGRAINDSIAPWQQTVTAHADTVREAGSKLHSSASAYSRVDDNLAVHLDHARRGLG